MPDGYCVDGYPCAGEDHIHSWGSWAVTKFETCTAPGTETRSCSTCGRTETKEIEMLSSSVCVASCTQWSNWSVKAATCDAAGDSTRTCQAGIDYTEVRVIALGHDWRNWTIKPATCDAAGDSTRVCSRGDSIDVRVIEQLSGFQCITYGTLDYVGQTYKTVQIGSQVWMAENLNYAGSDGSVGVCYNGQASNCNTYGRLYTWSEVMGFGSNCNISPCASQVQAKHQGICPVGWHVPSNAEWTTLTNFVGSNAGTKLKSQTGWNTGSGYISGTDEFGFSALPGGYRGTDGRFGDVGGWGGWWSATESAAGGARRRDMNWVNDNVDESWGSKSNGNSVRCLRD